MPYRFIKSWICDWRYELVGGAITILKNMKANGKDDIPYIMENKKCLKPPTSKKTVSQNLGQITPQYVV
jgi:hypothetical protein